MYLEIFCIFLVAASDYKKKICQGNSEVHSSIKELTQHLMQYYFGLSLL